MLLCFTHKLTRIATGIILLLIANIYSSLAQSLIRTPSSGTICVGQVVRYDYSGNCSSIGWRVEGSHTIISQTNTTLRVSWNSTTTQAEVVAYCHGNLSQTAGTSIFSVTSTNQTPIVSITGPSSICSGATATFHANSTRGGSSPSYQWKVNGVVKQSGADLNFSTNQLTDNDEVTVRMTSNASCLSTNIANSNTITVDVRPLVTASVSINDLGPICSGANVIFTASVTNGGSNPTYTWYRNGSVADDNQNTGNTNQYNPYYQLQSGDKVRCKITSNASCVSGGGVAWSNEVTITTQPPTNPSVSINLQGTGNYCAGDNITFTASSPQSITSYEWRIGGSAPMSTDPTFTVENVRAGFDDVISLTVGVTGQCLSSNTASSNTSGIAISVAPVVSSSVSISGPASICAGEITTYTATPFNGGSNPSYIWKVNGVTRSTVSTLTRSDFANGDNISVAMTSSAGCTTNATVSKTIEVLTTPPIPVANTTSGFSQATFAVQIPGSNTVYRWYDSQSAGTLVHTGTSYTTYRSGTWYVEAANENGCTSGREPYSVELAISDRPYNYIIRNTLLDKNIKNISEIPTLSTNELLQSVEYFDGLGRPMQVVGTKQSPSQQDIIQPIVYDDFGRPALSHLPYAYQSDDPGNYRPQAVSEQATFYQSADKIAHDARPYAENLYEESPLNRIKHTYGPGEAWHTNDKKASYSYRTDTANEVRVWIVNTIVKEVTSTRFYTQTEDTEGQLFATETTDEQGHKTIEYQNKQGQVVLKKVEASEGFLSTYYVYDAFNNLRLVIPPKAIKLLATGGDITLDINFPSSNTTVNDLCFIYDYDARNRMIRKQVPGAASVEMIYDQQDRLVLTQDGNQRKENAPDEWTFTKYDGLNRPVITGIYASSANRGALQGLIDAAGAAETRTNTAVGYTLTGSFPTTVSETDLLTITYYDDYAFSGYTSWDAEGLNYNFTTGKTGLDNTAYPTTADQLTAPTGQVTGSKTKVFGQNTWLNGVTYYDRKYRVIQSVQENLLGGTERVYQHYDFRGKPLAMLREHTVALGSPITYEQKYRYDHAERLLMVTHQLDGQDQVTLAQNEYNTLGKLIDKQLHSTDGSTFKQSVDYRYNIRGWLTHINNSSLELEPGINDEDNDYFGMELHYEDVVDALPMPSSELSSPKPTIDPTTEIIREADQIIRQQQLDLIKPTSQVTPPDSTQGWSFGLAPPQTPDPHTLTAGPGIALPDEATVIPAAGKVISDLPVLDDFSKGSGSTVNDGSGTGSSLNIPIVAPVDVSWLPNGELQINSTTRIGSNSATIMIINASKTSNELTMEVWVEASTTNPELSGQAADLFAAKFLYE